MSGIMNKVKELGQEVKSEVHKASGPKNTHGTTTTGTAGSSSTTGIGPSGTSTTTGMGGHSGSTNAGPHDSNLANKLDPKVGEFCGMPII